MCRMINNIDKEIKNNKENEVVKMKNTENTVNVIKNNDNERGNEIMNNFDMDKVIKYVAKAIKDSEEISIRFSDKSIGARQLQSALYYGAGKMRKQEKEYCKKVLNLIEIYNSTDFIKELYSAEGIDIFEVNGHPNNLFEVPKSDKLRELYYEGETLKRELIRDYALHKLPIMKELLNDFMEWKKIEIEYEYVLSAIMSDFEYDDMVNINDCIAEYINDSIGYTSILSFTDYEEDSKEGIIWENIQILTDADFLTSEYKSVLDEFKNEVIKEYR